VHQACFGKLRHYAAMQYRPFFGGTDGRVALLLGNQGNDFSMPLFTVDSYTVTQQYRFTVGVA